MSQSAARRSSTRCTSPTCTAPSCAGPRPDDEAGAGTSLAYSLHFAGDISGRFGLRMGLETARNLAANFLGEDGAELSLTEVSEVTGELANMFCGSVM